MTRPTSPELADPAIADKLEDRINAWVVEGGAIVALIGDERTRHLRAVDELDAMTRRINEAVNAIRPETEKPGYNPSPLDLDPLREKQY